jgi:YD repeat-containing protein
MGCGEVNDGLGRLTSVVEDPSGANYSTAYQYDPLDNLTLVTQGAQTPRAFQYSSLSRLTAAANPESGTTSYTYHESGDLASRTDARPVTASFSYDALRRITGKSYNDGLTPMVTYSYYLAGAGSFRVGQLQSVTSSAASAAHTSYDALGRVTASTHEIAGHGAPLSFGYTYWLHDTVKTVQYPSRTRGAIQRR